MISTVRDVTSLKKTEQQLQLSANIFQHTVEAIAVFDVDNYILKINMAFEKITGFTEQEVLGKKLETILRANYFDQVVKPGLSTLVNKILTTYQLKPQRLLQEVTEQAILNNPDVTIAELEAIQDLGVGINFDQLGEDYSTLEDIKRIGFNSVNTLSQPIAQQQHSPVIEQRIIALQNKISSLPLREAIVQNHILIGHRVITTVDTNQQTHYLTGRELTQTELLEFSNGLNVHNILSQRTTIN